MNCRSALPLAGGLCFYCPSCKEFEFTLLRTFASLRVTCSHPPILIAQLVLFQPRANRLSRCQGESHAPSKFGKLVALFVRGSAIPHFC
jgi:hypothetical protein